jgi:hypothetical protein
MSIFQYICVRLQQNLSSYFADELAELPCDDTTRAYVVSIFGKFPNGEFDYSKKSITVAYAEAREKSSFHLYQGLADWVFFCNSLFPEHLNRASIDYYYSVGRMSYYSCYRLMNREWKCFERMADELVDLSKAVRDIILLDEQQ